NPLNREAQITFRIPEPGPVNLVVYNQLGQVVARLAHEELPAGLHKRMWYPGSLAPGTYFIQLEAGGRMSIRKALLIH
ncbi:MAG: T9SS type A sorting domain-containing protein, partial [Anaerolineales bacterium]|nr:T9SS type A sorting domain-containing protein [Anaerolineales bacterium]